GAGTPTGTVTLVDGATTLGTAALTNGVATFSISTLVRGTHRLTAVYGGDATFETSNSSPLVQVVQTVALEPDPLDPAQMALVVGGTAGNDDIEIEQECSSRIEVEVRESNLDRFRYEGHFNGTFSRV